MASNYRFIKLKKHFIKALSVHWTLIYRINTKIAIKESINPFVAEFAGLIDNKAGIERVPDIINAK